MTSPTGTLILANLELGGHPVLMASGTGIAPLLVCCVSQKHMICLIILQ